MARLFDDASSEYLNIDQAVLSGTPLAMTCFFNTNDLTIHQSLMFLGDKNVEDHYFEVQLNEVSDRVLARTKDGGTTQFAITSTSYSANTWHHACAIFASPIDRRIFIDGGSKGTNTTSATPANLNRISIGRLGRLSPTLYLSGMIAEAVFYDLSKWPGATDSDKADNFEKIIPSLAAGFTPDNYPLGLIAYWDLIRGLNDKFGGYNLTANGTVVVAHPRIISPCGVV